MRGVRGSTMERKLPIGIQGFEKLRTENFLYVDKTDYIYQLVHNNVPYFLSRPRRFGKSLLLSALKAYWEGKKELFSGLKIEKLEADNERAWQTYPVFFFDFNGEDYSNVTIEEVLSQHLSEWENVYGNRYQGQTLGYRFQKLLEMAYQKTGLRCVVLVDEYDKPLLDLIDDEEKRNHTKKVFKGFFSRLKKADEYIQFIFITGVTKFHKVSIFSDLNQLRDISVNEDFSGLCGITEEEIRKNFLPEIEQLSKKQEITEDICFSKLREEYDGYHFHPKSCGIYNPYSLFNAFADKEFGSYWFETGTPSFLSGKLKEVNFDIRKFTDGSIYASEGMLKDYTGEGSDPVPLLYQTGYLTIAGYDPSARIFSLSFPNREVKYGFLESLIPEYIADYTAGSGKDIFHIAALHRAGKA